VGKGTVTRRVLEANPNLRLSVSATTRPPREGEIDGRDYRFVSGSEFDRLVAEGAFLEWAEVFGHRYGTLRVPIERELDAGHDVVLEIDVQGAAQVLERSPSAVLIFLEPPSEEELARRLRARGTESEDGLQIRLAGARWEMEQRPWFHHVVRNDDLEQAASDLAAIIARTH